MVVTGVASELEGFAHALEEAARSIRAGNALERLGESGPAPVAALHRAYNRLIDAAAEREREREHIAERENDVLLAFEELAREQAEALARQNAELRQQNEALKLADRMKNEFLANVSHELRTPLNAVIGFSELLLDGVAGALLDEQTEYIRDIQCAGQHLLGMIVDILDLSKLGAGRLRFERRRLDLAGPAREAAEIARPLALKKGQVFELHGGQEVPCVGDPQRIRQVALNLMSNAVKFTPRSGRITVSVRPGPDGAELVVEDTGIGIDPGHHALVFDMFRQIDGSTTREYAGTGLGLALVKRFTEAMGGTVSLHSRLGEGAAFTVRLPAPGPAAERELEAGEA